MSHNNNENVTNGCAFTIRNV